jgi:hypothetical protein
MRVVTDGASFAQCLVFENNGPGLLAMTLRAAFIPSGHRQSALRLEYVPTVRIVALNAAHPSFDHKVMLRQMKLAFDVEMALKTSGRILAWIDDEFGPAPCLDVFAARPVA